MSHTPQDPSGTEQQDQDAGPASTPDGAAGQESPGEDQDAGPASEPGPHAIQE